MTPDQRKAALAEAFAVVGEMTARRLALVDELRAVSSAEKTARRLIAVLTNNYETEEEQP